MAEYIDREAVIQAFCDGCMVEKDCHASPKRYVCAEVKTINAIPAADVRPVEHGVWLKNKYRRRCRDCGCAGAKDWKFCPVCGRQMKAEEDDG